MNTSDSMLIALSDRAYIKLKDMFKNHEINKYYRAIINGKLSEKDGTLEYPIGRNPHNRKLMTVIDSGRYAKTSYHVETENSDFLPLFGYKVIYRKDPPNKGTFFPYRASYFRRQGL